MSGQKLLTGAFQVYTGYLTRLAAQPGHYTVRVFVSDNRGQAAAPSRRGEQEQERVCHSAGSAVRAVVQTV